MLKEVSEVFDKTNSGATDPLIGVVDNKQAIIKISRNTYGPKVLVNEFICLEIAKILDLPIPNGGIGIINRNTNVEELLDHEISFEEVEGVCFFSEQLEKMVEFVDLSPELVNKIINKNDIVRVILFDHFIHNKDRHDGNILLKYAINSKSNIVFSIIDHSHVFNMENNWAQVNVGVYNEGDILQENEEVYSNFYSGVNINLEVLKEEARIFKDKLNESVIRDILNKLPEELLKIEDKDKILEYLLHRLNIIDDICCFIYENIKCPGGDINENSLFSSNI